MDDLVKASIRLDTTLETIKSDLVQLRNQDIKLMKQLIQISDTIQQITKRQIQQRPSFNAKGYLSHVLMFVNPSSISIRLETPLVRQQSVPAFCRMKECSTASSCSIVDGSGSSSFCDTPNNSSLSEFQMADNNFMQRQLSAPVSWNRPKSVSTVSAVVLDDLQDGDKYLEEVLMRNVKLWKLTQQIDNDSVFLEDSIPTNLYGQG